MKWAKWPKWQLSTDQTKMANALPKKIMANVAGIRNTPRLQFTENSEKISTLAIILQSSMRNDYMAYYYD
jgi:hypothetical protein